MSSHREMFTENYRGDNSLVWFVSVMEKKFDSQHTEYCDSGPERYTGKLAHVRVLVNGHFPGHVNRTNLPCAYRFPRRRNFQICIRN